MPLSVHASIAKIEDQGRRLLKGCRNLGPSGSRLSFNVDKATEILRTCGADAFDKHAEYLLSLEGFRPEWLRYAADQTLVDTLALIDPLDLIVDSVASIEVGVRETIKVALGKWKHSPSPKQVHDKQEGVQAVVSKPEPNEVAEHDERVAEIEAALNRNDRKKAVRLRIKLDGCTVTELWTEAFRQRFAKDSTKLTAFNRWHASRSETPSWADELMRARLLKEPSPPLLK